MNKNTETLISEKKTSPVAHTTFEYVPTTQEKRKQMGKTDNIFQKAIHVVMRLHWLYYIHLPFYVMTSSDAFYMHAFFLIILSLSLFGIIKYFCL